MKNLLKKGMILSVLGLGLFSATHNADAATKASNLVGGGGKSSYTPTYKEIKKVGKHYLNSYESPLRGGGSPLIYKTMR